MLVVVLFALGRAGIANSGAKFEHLAQHLVVRAGTPQAEVGGRIADVGAIEAGADALAHVHCLGGAGVGTAEAHLRAVHRMVDGIAERLVDVAGHVGVKRDHLADGHDMLPNICGEPARTRPVPIVTKAKSP